MKTMQEFLKEIAASKELLNELGAIDDRDTLEAFFKKNDCGATVEEFIEFVKSDSEGELSDNDAEAAAGGVPYSLLSESTREQLRKYWVTRL